MTPAGAAFSGNIWADLPLTCCPSLQSSFMSIDLMRGSWLEFSSMEACLVLEVSIPFMSLALHNADCPSPFLPVMHSFSFCFKTTRPYEPQRLGAVIQLSLLCEFSSKHARALNHHGPAKDRAAIACSENMVWPHPVNGYQAT